MSSARDLAQLKSDLLAGGLKLIDAANLKSSPGVRTGWATLDSFLATGGFPSSELSLVEAPEGLGALTLFIEAAAGITKQGSRVAWLNRANDEREPFQFHPPNANARGVDLQKLFLVDAPNSQKRGWILQELLASQLFSLVGCDLGDVHLPLREGRSLLMQARRSGAAVVLFSRRELREGAAIRSLTSLVLKFRGPEVEILRAAHRPVPHHLQRRNLHVDFINGADSALDQIAGGPAGGPVSGSARLGPNSCADD